MEVDFPVSEYWAKRDLYHTAEITEQVKIEKIEALDDVQLCIALESNRIILIYLRIFDKIIFLL